MNRTRRSVLIGIIVTAAAWTQGQHPAAEQAQTAKGGDAAVRAVADTYVKAVLAGDAKAVAALYTEDAVEMPPHQSMVKGRSAIQQYYEKQFAMGRPAAFTITHLETQSTGTHAHDVGTYRQTMKGADASQSVEDTGKFIVLLRRSGSDWRVAYAIYNSDRPQTR